MQKVPSYRLQGCRSSRLSVLSHWPDENRIFLQDGVAKEQSVATEPRTICKVLQQVLSYYARKSLLKITHDEPERPFLLHSFCAGFV